MIIVISLRKFIKVDGKLKDTSSEEQLLMEEK